MTIEKNYVGQNFDDFLKKENIEITKEDLINIIAKWKNQKDFDINAGIDYYKFLEKYKKGNTYENQCS